MARTGNDIALIMDPLCLNLHYSPVGGGRNVGGGSNLPKMEGMHGSFRNNRSQTLPPMNRYPLDPAVPLESYSSDYGTSKHVHHVSSAPRYLPRAIDLIERPAPFHPRIAHQYTSSAVIGQGDRSRCFDPAASLRGHGFSYSTLRKPLMDNISTPYWGSSIPTRSDPFLSSYSSPHYGHSDMDFMQLRRSVAAKVLAYKTIHGSVKKPYRKFIGDGRVSCANFLGGRIIPRRPHSRFFSGERMRIELELVAKYGGTDEEMQLHHSAHGRLREIPGMKGVYKLINSSDYYRHNVVADDPEVYIKRRFPRLLKTVRSDNPPRLHTEAEERDLRTRPGDGGNSTSSTVSKNKSDPIDESHSGCRKQSIDSSTNEVDCKHSDEEEHEDEAEVEPTTREEESQCQEVAKGGDEHDVESVDPCVNHNVNQDVLSDTEHLQEPPEAENKEDNSDCEIVPAERRDSYHNESDLENGDENNQVILTAEDDDCHANEEETAEPSGHDAADYDNGTCDKVDGNIGSPQPDVREASAEPEVRDLISPSEEDEQADAEYTLTLHGNETEYTKEDEQNNEEEEEEELISHESELANEAVDQVAGSQSSWDPDQRPVSREELSGAEESAARVQLMKSEAAQRLADLDQLINEHQQIVKEIKRTQSFQGSVISDQHNCLEKAEAAEPQLSRASSAEAAVSRCSERDEAASDPSQRSLSPASELEESAGYEQQDTAGTVDRAGSEAVDFADADKTISDDLDQQSGDEGEEEE